MTHNEQDVERVARAIFEHEQSRRFPPTLTNIALYGQERVTWDFINSEQFVQTCSEVYREKAKAALSAMQQSPYKDYTWEDIAMLVQENNTLKANRVKNEQAAKGLREALEWCASNSTLYYQLYGDLRPQNASEMQLRAKQALAQYDALVKGE